MDAGVLWSFCSLYHPSAPPLPPYRTNYHLTRRSTPIGGSRPPRRHTHACAAHTPARTPCCTHSTPSLCRPRQSRIPRAILRLRLILDLLSLVQILLDFGFASLSRTLGFGFTEWGRWPSGHTPTRPSARFAFFAYLQLHLIPANVCLWTNL